MYPSAAKAITRLCSRNRFEDHVVEEIAGAVLIVGAHEEHQTSIRLGARCGGELDAETLHRRRQVDRFI